MPGPLRVFDICLTGGASRPGCRTSFAGHASSRRREGLIGVWAPLQATLAATIECQVSGVGAADIRIKFEDFQRGRVTWTAQPFLPCSSGWSVMLPNVVSPSEYYIC